MGIKGCRVQYQRVTSSFIARIDCAALWSGWLCGASRAMWFALRHAWPRVRSWLLHKKPFALRGVGCALGSRRAPGEVAKGNVCVLRASILACARPGEVALAEVCVLRSSTLACARPPAALALARPLSPALARRGQTNARFSVRVHVLERDVWVRVLSKRSVLQHMQNTKAAAVDG